MNRVVLMILFFIFLVACDQTKTIPISRELAGIRLGMTVDEFTNKFRAVEVTKEWMEETKKSHDRSKKAMEEFLSRNKNRTGDPEYDKMTDDIIKRMMQRKEEMAEELSRDINNNHRVFELQQNPPKVINIRVICENNFVIRVRVTGYPNFSKLLLEYTKIYGSPLAMINNHSPYLFNEKGYFDNAYYCEDVYWGNNRAVLQLSQKIEGIGDEYGIGSAGFSQWITLDQMDQSSWDSFLRNIKNRQIENEVGMGDIL